MRKITLLVKAILESVAFGEARTIPKGRLERLKQIGQALRVEQLEDRIALIVGANAVPAPVLPGTGYDGVVKVVQDDVRTGSLFQTGLGQGLGHHILTAAHVVNPANPTTIVFDMARDGVGVPVSITVPAGAQYQIRHPNYATDAEYDVAVLKLVDAEDPTPNRLLVAPFGAERYGLYTQADEVGKVSTIVGYGQTGTGATGEVLPRGTKRLGRNRFDLGSTASLKFDFDNGIAINDAFGSNENVPDLGLGDNECMIASGDSGGPEFLDGLIAGVNRAGGNIYGSPPDINNVTDSTFGEVGLGVRVSTIVDSFITPIVAPQSNSGYDLVLDMSKQVVGASVSGENDVAITAKQVGGNLVLSVDAPGNQYDGEYYSAPIANIKSLRGCAKTPGFLIQLHEHAAL